MVARVGSSEGEASLVRTFQVNDPVVIVEDLIDGDLDTDLIVYGVGARLFVP